MKPIPVQEFLIGPLALICAVAVFVAAILDVPQDTVTTPTVVTGASR